MKTPFLIIVAVLFCSVATVSQSHAASLPLGAYSLGSHPDGNQNPPIYGLRLDGLIGGSSGDVFTFDFNAPGGDMNMSLVPGATSGTFTINIFGTVFGGLQSGSTYVSGKTGTFELDFSYKVAIPVSGDDDLIVKEEANNGVRDIGTIKLISSDITHGSYTLEQDDVINLRSKSNGSYTFRLGDENNDAGHRGFNGISGWGWLNHDGPGADITQHIAASDFLFTATYSGGLTVVPVPAAAYACLIGFGLLGGKKAVMKVVRS